MNMPLIALFSNVVLLAGVLTGGISQTPSYCAGAQSLGFWVGRWEVVNPRGVVVAESNIERVAEGCAILERYAGKPGPQGQVYHGAGLHYFDAAANEWRQFWSDNRPAMTEMHGKVTDGAVVYEWTVKSPQGQMIPKRYTLSKIENGVRQHGERSDDAGKTWTTEFDLRYRPMAK